MMKTLGKIATFTFGALFGSVAIATIYMSSDEVSDSWEAAKKGYYQKSNSNTK